MELHCLHIITLPSSNLEICSVRISFKGKLIICKFYVVEYSTMILGVTDSDKLGLVKVKFWCNWKRKLDQSYIHNIESESDCLQEGKLKPEFLNLFKGIGCMDREISIKLHDGAIPHTEPIRHVLQAMQQPLYDELDKFVKEKDSYPM